MDTPNVDIEHVLHMHVEGLDRYSGTQQEKAR